MDFEVPIEVGLFDCKYWIPSKIGLFMRYCVSSKIRLREMPIKVGLFVSGQVKFGLFVRVK